MSFQNIRRYEGTFQPAAVNADETKAILNVKKGDRVIAVQCQKLILAASSTNSSFDIGDGDDPNGYVASLDPEAGSVGDLVDGAGALFGSNLGKLYTADDTVDIVYTDNTTPGATNPKIRWIIFVLHAGG